jgi:uncharacterized protein (DUF2267 family)
VSIGGPPASADKTDGYGHTVPQMTACLKGKETPGSGVPADAEGNPVLRSQCRVADDEHHPMWVRQGRWGEWAGRLGGLPGGPGLVHRRGGADARERRRDRRAAIRATLTTLGERVGADEGRVLVTQLPPGIGPLLYTTGGPTSFDAEEFVRRVAGRENVDRDTAERHAATVLAVLARAISDQEYDHLVGRLSRDYGPLLPKGAIAVSMSPRSFVERVMVRTRLDQAMARRAVEAVLETLAERIAGGDVDDLMARLPIPFHAALKRGKVQADSTTLRMTAEEFVRRVARRLDTSDDRARDTVGAVLATVHEATREEFLDVTVQLPEGYRDLLNPRQR